MLFKLIVIFFVCFLPIKFLQNVSTLAGRRPVAAIAPFTSELDSASPSSSQTALSDINSTPTVDEYNPLCPNDFDELIKVKIEQRKKEEEERYINLVFDYTVCYTYNGYHEILYLKFKIIDN